MKNKIIWSIFLGTLVIAGAGCGAKQAANLQTTPGANQAATQPAAQGGAQNESISGSIKDLLKLGRSIKCDLAKASKDIVAGEVYISGKKARSDFQIKDSTGKTSTGHFILDNTTMYSWTDQNKAQAMKIDVAELEKQAGTTQASNSGADNYSNNSDYRCTNWSVDSSMFVPPADVKFSDFSALMQQLQNRLPAGINTQALCGGCDKITDANTKAQCKQSLGCK